MWLHPKHSASSVLVLFALGSVWSASAQQRDDDAPCKQVETVEGFDLHEFVSAPWYAHQQAENTFAPPNQACVKAEYTIRDSPSLPWGYSVDVLNTGRLEDGSPAEANLCAFQPDGADSTKAGKLRVAPCFLPKALSGDFWVVAYDERKGYALVAAGQPTRPGTNGCRTGTADGSSDSGLWVFSRSPDRDDSLVATVRALALDAGFDTTVLKDVPHTDCDPTHGTLKRAETS